MRIDPKTCSRLSNCDPKNRIRVQIISSEGKEEEEGNNSGAVLITVHHSEGEMREV